MAHMETLLQRFRPPIVPLEAPPGIIAGPAFWQGRDVVQQQSVRRRPIACGLHARALGAIFAAAPAHARFELSLADGQRLEIGRVDMAALRWLSEVTAAGSGNRLAIVLSRK